MTNKEYGSDFHYISNSDFRINSGVACFFNGTEQFYFSGRVALRAIICNGIDKHSWKKIYIPTYYCHEVYDFIRDLNICLEFYECNPETNVLPSSIEDEGNSALLVVNYFGISTANFEHLKNIKIIEDVTHDLSTFNLSKADYVFGSLRKILPVPVGGFVKSNEVLPKVPLTLFAENVTQEKFAGMLLKKKYLEGNFKEKEIFRALLINAEHSFENPDTFSILPQSVKGYLLGLDVTKIIEVKRQNSVLAKKAIHKTTKFELLISDGNNEYALIFKFNNTEQRELLKKKLILHKIYPMVLWPNQLNEKDIELENRLLFVHIDFRYS